MKVIESVTLEEYPNYALEFGISTWSQNLPVDQQEESVRNRYDTESGKFSPHGSSELPMRDVAFIVCECIKRDKLTSSELADILNEVGNALKRKDNGR